jgi:hypothetical protein
VAYFFYSSLLGYFENIPVQPFDEGRGSLQRLCLGIFSNRFVFEEKQFDWRPALLPAAFAARSSYFASAISRSLPATNSAVSTPMMCRQINGASLICRRRCRRSHRRMISCQHSVVFGAFVPLGRGEQPQGKQWVPQAQKSGET